MPSCEAEALSGRFRRAPDQEEIRLALLLCEEVFPDPEAVMRRLTYSNHAVRRVLNLISLKDMPLQTETDIRRVLSRLVTEFPVYLQFRNALEDDLDAGKIQQMHQAVTSRNDCCHLRDLAVSGYDVMKLGFRGKEIAEQLDDCLNAVIENRVPNDKIELTEYMKKNGRK